ncbi:hypothetical protein [Pedobacter sp.]
MMKNLNKQINYNALGYIILLLTLVCSACKKDKEWPEMVIPTKVSFNATTYNIPKDATSFPVQLKLARPLEKDGKVTIQVQSSGTTALNTEYSINPQLSGDKFTLDLPKGATTASFNITSGKNFDDNKTVSLKIVSASGGAVLGESVLATSLTLRGRNWIEPSLVASLAALPTFGNTTTSTETPSQSYTITGANLSGNVTITASDYFKISTNNTSFSSSLSVDANNKTATIYVKFAPSSKQNKDLSGTITHSIAGLQNITVNVSGTEIGNVAPVAEVPLMNENFSYGNAEDFLARVTNTWTAYSAAGSIPVYYVPQGLSFAGYVNSGIGGALTFQHGDFSREDVMSAFTPQTSGTVYTAMMINLKTAGAGDFYCALRDGAGAFFNRLYAKDDGKGNLILGMGKNSTAVYGAANYKYNTSYLLVIKHDFATKISSMYILDGTIPATEPSTATVASAATGTSPTSLNDIIIRQADGELSGTVDGIRIATTWKGVLGLTN